MPTWTRIRDTATGHQWDVDERALPMWLRTPGIERVDRVEPLSGPATHPRPAKHFTGLDGKPRLRTAQPAEPPADAAEETQ